MTTVERIDPGEVDQYFDLDELNDLEVEDIRRTGSIRAWYWYATAPYEGTGHVLLQFEKGWNDADLGHCSCYGPTDSLPSKPAYDSLEALEAAGTDEWTRKHAGCLIAAARKVLRGNDA